ncbi:hypothetical protein T484DRAFT_1838492, partial [Baffinella frigidus]
MAPPGRPNDAPRCANRSAAELSSGLLNATATGKRVSRPSGWALREDEAFCQSKAPATKGKGARGVPPFGAPLEPQGASAAQDAGWLVSDCGDAQSSARSTPAKCAAAPGPGVAGAAPKAAKTRDSPALLGLSGQFGSGQAAAGAGPASAAFAETTGEVDALGGALQFTALTPGQIANNVTAVLRSAHDSMGAGRLNGDVGGCWGGVSGGGARNSERGHNPEGGAAPPKGDAQVFEMLECAPLTGLSALKPAGIKKLTIGLLRELCTKHNLGAGGSKPELLERLLEAEAAERFWVSALGGAGATVEGVLGALGVLGAATVEGVFEVLDVLRVARAARSPPLPDALNSALLHLE